MKQEALLSYTADALKDAELSVKLNEMLWHIVDGFNTDLSDTKNKYVDTDKLSDEAIKQKIIEQGYDYIKSVMDNINGLQFNKLLLFLDLIAQLKGTRVGIELVLQLLGFSALIEEWWQVNPKKPRWSYEITVFMDLSLVANPYDTLDKIRVFSRFYQIANISNIDLEFVITEFAQRAPIMAGFFHHDYFADITQRVP